MQQKLDEKKIAEQTKAEENRKLVQSRMKKFLKDDAKIHLDTLFEDLFQHVKNFAWLLFPTNLILINI